MAVGDLPSVAAGSKLTQAATGTVNQVVQAWAERANAVAYSQTTRQAACDSELTSIGGVAANVPNPPAIGTATQTGATTATVAFTASTDNGGSAVTSYTSTSSPGGVTKNGASSPLAVTGLTTATPYTFKVYATNANGNSLQSAASNSITTA
jgi:hypothetical protein